MYPIPQDKKTQDELVAEVRQSVEDMRGVAGFSVLRTRTPGDVNDVSGGIQADMRLRRVLGRMRMQPVDAFGGKLAILCTKPEEEWRIIRLSGVRGVPPAFADDRVFTDEQDAQAEIFKMRLEQYPETDGMPEHYEPSWKSRGENWSV